MAGAVVGLVAAHTMGSAVRKAVMMCLAEHADSEYLRTWVGRRRIMAETELGETTVKRCLQELERDGLIVRTARFREDGGRTSDVTTIVAAAVRRRAKAIPYLGQTGERADLTPPAPVDPPRSTDDPPRSRLDPPPVQSGPDPRSPVDPEPSLEPSKEPGGSAQPKVKSRSHRPPPDDVRAQVDRLRLPNPPPQPRPKARF